MIGHGHASSNLDLRILLLHLILGLLMLGKFPKNLFKVVIINSMPGGRISLMSLLRILPSTRNLKSSAKNSWRGFPFLKINWLFCKIRDCSSTWHLKKDWNIVLIEKSLKNSMPISWRFWTLMPFLQRITKFKCTISWVNLKENGFCKEK